MCQHHEGIYFCMIPWHILLVGAEDLGLQQLPAVGISTELQGLAKSGIAVQADNTSSLPSSGWPLQVS